MSRPRSTLRQEREAQFRRYKQDVAERGKPFFPHAMFHDTVMSLLVVAVILALAIIWHETLPDKSINSTRPGWLGPQYDAKADPGTATFVPRPDWYFYFLFYLLRVFKWPNSVFIATIGIPTIALILLLGLPFYDRQRERRLSRRPVAVVAAALVVASMGLLTYRGATAKEGGSANVPKWTRDLNLTAAALPGAKLFAELPCLSCHTYDGTGGAQLGAPDLTAEGTRGRGVAFQIKHLQDPSSVHPGSPMPPFAQLGTGNLEKLAIFLESSCGVGGHSKVAGGQPRCVKSG
jgi:menaquinol-cytochrome c reductase cytochrome b/c subunit